MSNNISDFCTISANIGTIAGGLTGFALGVWTAVAHVQPAFDSIDGISSEGASGITAAIFLLGGIEAFIAAGALAGAIAGPVVTTTTAGLVIAGNAVTQCISQIQCPKVGFFHRNQPTDHAPQPQTSKMKPAKEPDLEQGFQEDHSTNGGNELDTQDDLNQNSFA